MLKKFFSDIKLSAKCGMFKNHFIGQMIRNREDKESFYIYYQDKVGAIALSSLLDLDFNAEGNEFKINSPLTGKSATLSFYFAPPFIDDASEEYIHQDVENLINCQEFLLNEIKAKFPNAKEFDSFFHAWYYVVSYLLNSSQSEDQFKVQKLAELLTCAKNRLFIARPETTCFDQDILMASAWKSINFITHVAKLPKYQINRFTSQHYVNNMNQILEAEFNLSLEQRNSERVNAYSFLGDERRTKKSGFWEYKKICDNLEKNSEMW